MTGRWEPPREGALLKGPDRRIHLFNCGKHRWIASMALFEGHGFWHEDVRLTLDDVLDEIPEEPLIE